MEETKYKLTEDQKEKLVDILDEAVALIPSPFIVYDNLLDNPGYALDGYYYNEQLRVNKKYYDIITDWGFNIEKDKHKLIGMKIIILSDSNDREILFGELKSVGEFKGLADKIDNFKSISAGESLKALDDLIDGKKYKKVNPFKRKKDIKR